MGKRHLSTLKAHTAFLGACVVALCFSSVAFAQEGGPAALGPDPRGSGPDLDPRDDLGLPPNPSDVQGSTTLPGLSSTRASAGTTQEFRDFNINAENLASDKDKNNLLQAYNGWSKAYDGYSRTPILFDSLKDGKTRKYPSLSFDSKSKDGDVRKESQENSLRVFNLGVDDEVQKSALAVFLPLSTMQNDIANDPNERDRFLDLFNTYNGIAKLTLSYLDKTVGAGLEVTQQQINIATQNQLLKQIAITSSQVANPQRAMLYRDVDEKLEACLAYGGAERAKKQNDRIQLNCPDSCLAKRSDGSRNTPPTSMGQGLFSYCVCCAQSANELNFATKQKEKSTAYMSLVDLNLLGDSLPTTGDATKRTYVMAFRDEVREMYGDRILTNCGAFPLDGDIVSKANSQKDSESCTGAKYKFEYFVPRYSISDKINLFRNGVCEKDSKGNAIACPQTQTPIREGICPSMRMVLAATPEQMRDPKIIPIWVQASLGRVIDARDLSSIKTAFSAEDLGTLDLSSKRVDGANYPPALERWLADYCDASAVAAFKKYHYRMVALTEDHLRLNQRASAVDKAQLRELVSRVTDQIELAERDRGAASVATTFLAGIGAQADAKQASEVAAAVESVASNIAERSLATTIFSGGVRQSTQLYSKDPVVTFPTNTDG